eukprot:1554619-Amphidinium_carterae.2
MKSCQRPQTLLPHKPCQQMHAGEDLLALPIRMRMHQGVDKLIEGYMVWLVPSTTHIVLHSSTPTTTTGTEWRVAPRYNCQP